MERWLDGDMRGVVEVRDFGPVQRVVAADADLVLSLHQQQQQRRSRERAA